MSKTVRLKIRKGFTLIELLAVITILSIILVIAVPSVTSIVNSAKKNSFENDAKIIIKAIDTKKASDPTFDPTTVNASNIDTLLKISGSNYSSLAVTKNGSDDIGIAIVGQGKWNGLVACGNLNDMKAYERVSCVATVPTISTQPESASYAVGGTANPLAVVATVNDGETLTYQWQKSTDGGSTYSDIVGATSSTYTPSVSSASTNKYRCVVTNTFDGNTASTISNAATITVMAAFAIENKLDGTVLNSSYQSVDFETVQHQYTFTGGTPTSVTLNGVTSNTMVEKLIVTYGGVSAFVRAYTDGRITLYNNGDASGTSSGSLNCSISFNMGSSTDSDNFIIRGFIDMCFVAGTLVKTPNGYTKVEDIKEDDIILTYNMDTLSVMECRIDEFYLKNGCPNIRKITLSNGAVIGVTPTHSFYTIDGWKCCEPNEHLTVQAKLNIGDKFNTFDGDIVEVVNIETDNEPQPVYHLVLEDGNNLFVTNDEKYSPIISEHYYKYDEELGEGIGGY